MGDVIPPAFVAAGRDFGCCVRCGILVVSLGALDLGDMPGRGERWSIHHRVAGNRADMRLSNLLTLCGDGVRGCHGWITGHPEEAYDEGWAVRHAKRWETASIPVLYGQRQVRRAGKFVLDDAGGLAVAA